MKDQHIPQLRENGKYLHYDALDENYQQIEIEICAGIIIYPLKQRPFLDKKICNLLMGAEL